MQAPARVPALLFIIKLIFYSKIFLIFAQKYIQEDENCTYRIRQDGQDH